MMSSLRLPDNAASILERAYRGEADTSEIDDEWLIYVVGEGPPYAKELAHLAMDFWQPVQESERDELSFSRPAVQAGTNLSLQNALDYHLQLCKRQVEGAEPRGEDEQQCYIFGFIALTRPDWKENGVTIVHCDKDRGQWKVTQCSGVPINKLGMEATSVSDMDDQFDNIRVQYDDSDNTGDDNIGGPAPQGKWQFLVYCEGISTTKVEDLIPDPRGNPDWPMGEACLITKAWDRPFESIQEDFPLAYANFVGNPIVPANGQPSICKRHPSLFAIARGDDLRSISIVKMDWDQSIARSDEDLKGVGRTSQVTMHNCDPASVVPTLDRLAVKCEDSV
jgi:hypothetical protein